jgi:hypothetical protein
METEKIILFLNVLVFTSTHGRNASSNGINSFDFFTPNLIARLIQRMLVLASLYNCMHILPIVELTCIPHWHGRHSGQILTISSCYYSYIRSPKVDACNPLGQHLWMWGGGMIDQKRSQNTLDVARSLHCPCVHMSSNREWWRAVASSCYHIMTATTEYLRSHIHILWLISLPPQGCKAYYYSYGKR